MILNQFILYGSWSAKAFWEGEAPVEPLSRCVSLLYRLSRSFALPKTVSARIERDRFVPGLVGFLLLVACVLGFASWTLADDQPNQTSDASDAPKPTLAATQEAIEMRYRRFESSLQQLSEYLRKTDPARAELLVRAIGKSKEGRIPEQLQSLTELLKKDQLGDAIERQELVVAELQALLELLMSEARKDEIELEKARIRDLIKDVAKLIGKETEARAETERGGKATDLQNKQKQVSDSTKKLMEKIESQDAAKKSNKNDKEADSRDKSDQQNGDKSNDKDDSSDEKQPDDGQNPDSKDPNQRQSPDGSKDSRNPDGKPKSDGDQQGEDKKQGSDKDSSDKSSKNSKSDEKKLNEKKAGDDSRDKKNSKDDPSKPEDQTKPEESQGGKPQEGNQQPSKPQKGKPKPGKSQDGQPQEGQEQQDQSDEGQDQSDEGSENEQNQQKQPDRTAGRDELKRAKQEMDRAIEELKKSNRKGASDKQDKAIAELMKAKEKLEEILRLVRQEELELVLAQMEARFRNMLIKQEAIYNATLALHAIPEDGRTDRHRNRAVELARNEEEIALLAAKALTLLKEEGSSVAFPEAVEQIHDDMQTIARRLERVDVGEITQTIEQDTLESLKEIIEAMQKEIEKLKDKQQQQQQQQQQEQQQQQQGLVNPLAEMKMLRSLQYRVNRRTKQLGRMVDGEQAVDPDILNQLKQLSDRQAKVQKATYDLATGKNQ